VGLDNSVTSSPVSGPAAKLISLSGRAVSWFVLVMVLLTFAIVVMRYGFNLGWIALQESVTYMHAAVFMIAAAWTFQCDEHVRVDIFYRGKSLRHQAWVNLLGTVLLLVPFALFLLIVAWQYVASSWSVMEGSREAGGLPLVYLLKSLILILPALLLVQSFSTIKNCVSRLRTH
jgi:TRAP-type mannitol/chloroaromatic compound transport system permease small subunit